MEMGVSRHGYLMNCKTHILFILNEQQFVYPLNQVNSIHSYQFNSWQGPPCTARTLHLLFILNVRFFFFFFCCLQETFFGGIKCVNGQYIKYAELSLQNDLRKIFI